MAESNTTSPYMRMKETATTADDDQDGHPRGVDIRPVLDQRHTGGSLTRNADGTSIQDIFSDCNTSAGSSGP